MQYSTFSVALRRHLNMQKHEKELIIQLPVTLLPRALLQSSAHLERKCSACNFLPLNNTWFPTHLNRNGRRKKPFRSLFFPLEQHQHWRMGPVLEEKCTRTHARTHAHAYIHMGCLLLEKKTRLNRFVAPLGSPTWLKARLNQRNSDCTSGEGGGGGGRGGRAGGLFWRQSGLLQQDVPVQVGLKKEPMWGLACPVCEGKNG